MPTYKNITSDNINNIYEAVAFNDGITLEEAQIKVDEWILANTYKKEAKQFLNDNPNARLLLELSPEDLETTIENRTAGQETLLLKTLAFAVRYLYAEVRNQDS